MKKKQHYPVDTTTGDIKLPKVKTQLTAPLYEKRHERNNGKSMTVPNQAMSVLEMLKRHRQGLPLDQARGALFHEGDEPVRNLDHMDLVDRQAYMDSVADALVEVRARLQAQMKTKAEKEFMDKVDAAVRERLAKMPKSDAVTDIQEEK